MKLEAAVLEFENQDEAKREVTGVVGVAEVPNTNKFALTREDLKQAAADLRAGRVRILVGHDARQDVTDQIRVERSFVSEEPLKLGDLELPPGAWVVKLRVLDDELWARIADGELTGLSVAGLAGERVSTGWYDRLRRFVLEEISLVPNPATHLGFAVLASAAGVDELKRRRATLEADREAAAREALDEIRNPDPDLRRGFSALVRELDGELARVQEALLGTPEYLDAKVATMAGQRRGEGR